MTDDGPVLDGSNAGSVAGTILRGPAFEPVEGRVVWADGEITAVEETAVDSDRVVVPAFVNAHTHVGGSVAKEAVDRQSLETPVAPPNGDAPSASASGSGDELVAAMARTLAYMTGGGTAAHLDFRAGGVGGVEALDRAGVDGRLQSVVLGRESEDAMAHADGVGASDATDASFERLRRAARDAEKLFGVHAGEADEGDVNAALDVDPDFVVHMVHATQVHLERIADSQTPVVVCPRSNAVTGVGRPPIRALHERTTVALGTDDVALNPPSMFREMAWTAKLHDVPSTEVLAMATRNGASIADLNCGVVEPGRDAKLLALDGDSRNLAGVDDVVRGVVRRASVDDVERVVL